MTQYLDLEDVLEVAQRAGFPVRDVGLLASAVARPVTTVMGTEAYPTLELKAAALLESMVRNHGMIDGNKRTGWLAAVAFLWINGYQHNLDADGVFHLVVGIAAGEIALEESAATIGAHLISRA